MPTSKKASYGRQYAALPLTEQDHEMRVMLVTSRDTGRWVLPKGWAEKGLTGPQLAAKEAFEEAGIVGDVSSDPVGKYHYAKAMPKGRTVECAVVVFPLWVGRLLEDWPEREQRRREWFTFGQAAMAVDEGELVTLLLQLGAPAA